ncbi:hypothetical protein ES288_A12G270500v1 [Gossypium darwinii]|nr:hypothetical protein ES288_A12G270500v1 [Gossypium darwinii]
MVWVIYGLPMVHPNSTLVITINGAGTAIELVYLTLFLIFCHDKKKRLKGLLIALVEKLVISTKSVEYMPFFLSLASFANGVAWTTYAFLPFDPFIAVPNGLGTLFSLAQLLLYATYYESTKRIIAARKETKMEVNLSEVVVNGNHVPKKTTRAT